MTPRTRLYYIAAFGVVWAAVTLWLASVLAHAVCFSWGAGDERDRMACGFDVACSDGGG